MRPSRVEIREPFPEEAWPRVFGWMQPCWHQACDDFVKKDVGWFVDSMIELSLRSRTWGVWREGELGGLIALEPLNPVAGLAHLVFKKSFWGSKTTLAAANQALEKVLGGGEAGKICGHVFPDNHPMRAMYGKLGFREEGRLRGQTMRNGKPADVIACGLTREMWAARAAGERDVHVRKDHDDKHVFAGGVESPEPGAGDAQHGAVESGLDVPADRGVGDQRDRFELQGRARFDEQGTGEPRVHE